MRTSLLIIISLFLSTSLALGQITFEKGTWKEIRNKAKSENKAIFVDAYTDWCGPCKWMAANLFPLEEVGDFFNNNFVNYQLDQEKGEGPEFAKTYGVRAYPTLLFFNSEGEMVHKGVGAPPNGEFLISLAQDALNPEKQFVTLKKRYEEGDRDPQFLKNYALALSSAYEDGEEVATEYLQSLPIDSWSDKENFEFIAQMITNYQSDIFQYVVQNQPILAEKNGKEEVDNYINRVMSQAIYMVARGKSEEQLKSFKEQVEKVVPEQAEYFKAKADYIFYSRDKEKRHGYAVAYFNGFEISANELNSIAWNYYQTEEDPERLAQALDWANRSVKMEEGYYNTDTQAHLLFKLKQYPEAQVAATKSIEIGKEAGEDVSGTEELLEKIQAKIEMGDRAD